MAVTRTKKLKKRSAKKRGPKPLRRKSKVDVSWKVRQEVDWEGVRRAIDELEHTVSNIYAQGKAVADSVALLRQQLPAIAEDTEDDIPF